MCVCVCVFLKLSIYSCLCQPTMLPHYPDQEVSRLPFSLLSLCIFLTTSLLMLLQILLFCPFQFYVSVILFSLLFIFCHTHHELCQTPSDKLCWSWFILPPAFMGEVRRLWLVVLVLVNRGSCRRFSVTCSTVPVSLT